MLRHDMTAAFYQVEFQPERGKPWRGFNTDCYDDRTLPTFKPGETGLKPSNSMGAGGSVWQSTGQHGTTDIDHALEVARFLVGQHPGYAFRVVLKKVSQVTEVVAGPEDPRIGPGWWYECRSVNFGVQPPATVTRRLFMSVSELVTLAGSNSFEAFIGLLGRWNGMGTSGLEHGMVHRYRYLSDLNGKDNLDPPPEAAFPPHERAR